ncbi:MAG: hypothetical protein AB1489_30315 [Acidobacteriota bacterium]
MTITWVSNWDNGHCPECGIAGGIDYLLGHLRAQHGWDELELADWLAEIGL